MGNSYMDERDKIFNNIDMELLNQYIQRNNDEDDIILIKKNKTIVLKSNKSKNIFMIIIDWFIDILSSSNDVKFCGIQNIGNNCYLNSGLQILARCYPFVIELLNIKFKKNNRIIQVNPPIKYNNELSSFSNNNKYNNNNEEIKSKYIDLILESMITLLFKENKYYQPNEFIDYFCRLNKEFKKGYQNCSQNFIRTLLDNLNNIFEKNTFFNEYKPTESNEKNAYDNFLKSNRIFPESKINSIFSGIIKMKTYGVCRKCQKRINEFSFNYFVDLVIYLNDFNSKSKFSDILKKNIGESCISSMECPNCKEEINTKSKSSIIKLPEIFIFTIERFTPRNTIPIEPDDEIILSDYIDDSSYIEDVKYELFAINIRIGETLYSGHQFCQIKENNKWYEINDNEKKIANRKYERYSHGLFYKKISNKI